MAHASNLSPAAQAVLDAFLDTPGCEPLPGWDYKRDIATALRAAADQLYDSPSQDYLWAIADELSSANHTEKATKND